MGVLGRFGGGGREGLGVLGKETGDFVGAQ